MQIGLLLSMDRIDCRDPMHKKFSGLRADEKGE